jgi:dCMP deaminase
VKGRHCTLHFQSGIKRVVYHNGYRDDSGLQFLIKAGIEVEHIPVLED